MATFQELKKITVGYRNKTDYTSVDVVRDEMVNLARKEIYNTYPFRWSRASTTLSLSSNKADLPSDYNPIFGIHYAKDENDNVYTQIDPNQQHDYTDTDDYVFWIDYDSSSGKYVFHTPSSATSMDIIYSVLPADLSDDSDEDLCPDPEAIGLLAAAKLWMAKERDETNHDRYMALAQKRINQLVANDRKWAERKRTKTLGERYNLGYTQRSND